MRPSATTPARLSSSNYVSEVLHELHVSRKSTKEPLDRDVLSILYFRTRWRKSQLILDDEKQKTVQRKAV